MTRIRDEFSTAGLISMALLTSACATRLAVLETTTETDPALSCAQLDQAVANAIEIRNQAIEEGKVQAINDMIGARDVSAQLVVGVFAIGVPLPDDGSPAHLRSQRAAEARLRQLVDYKRERSCPPRPTRDPDRSDLDLLEALETLDQARVRGEINRDEHHSRRTALFDDL